ncbi:MAG: 4-hydroxybenzoate octaprenyltransferase [Armatimonadota bacterium]
MSERVAGAPVVAFLRMIKVEHSIFALPFAMVGMVYAADGFPGWRIFLLILLAMISARSAAMAFNRLVDHQLDALNPRTNRRELVTGAISRRKAWAFFGVCVALFLSAAALLNPLAFALAPVALVVLLGYSYTKRFTSFCHIFVGLSLGIAPVGAWVAVRGTLDVAPFWWLVAVTFWTAGFDILYALQDEEFDRTHGVHSLVVRLGRARAILVSRVFHATTVVALAAAGWEVGASIPYLLGVFFVLGLLMVEQSLVAPDDLSRIDAAFFAVNGWVSVGFLVFVLVDVAL